MKSITKKIATILFLFTVFFAKTQKLMPDDQQYAEFYYAEFGAANADTPKILVISSYIYKLKENFADAASVVLEPYFYSKIEQIKKDGFNGNLWVLKSKIKRVYAVTYNGKMSSYIGDQDIQFNKNVKSTSAFVLNARQAILDTYQQKGYTIYQTDFTSDFAKSSYYKRTSKVEKLLSSYIEEYKAGTLSSNVTKTGPKPTENKDIASDKEHQSKGIKGNEEVKKYNDSGKLLASGYKSPDGKATGRWEFYYESGKLKEEGSFKDGKETGWWKIYFESGKPKETGNYKNGLKDGEWKIYFENGNLDMVTNHKDGKLVGEGKTYYQNGKLSGIGNHSADGKYITQKLYYENGNLESEGKYIINTNATAIITSGKAVPIGEWKLYHENGKLKAIGNYGGMNKDDLTGEWKMYDENGTLREVASSFIAGVPMKSQKYDENGKPVN
ncbi:toxin-antitoxin system YwqK family antitoxin [Chryseobacterium camelliae]|uniref:Toxin-antitoxin system YwqK family antitoxin n=1 Tax=Chryseobacterium camelliae TaxID=1265445 RepID=A0ABY7QMW0_9FLAO|nr:toxin-antitoxin system YwqK family antitoxin [Chryseobacterium camelliae]WBV60041.1 toxin-antitoxin system YwqK family antitoxin [Chryseobacterium camelliae]